MSAVRSRHVPGKNSGNAATRRWTADESKDRRQSLGFSRSVRFFAVASVLLISFCIGSILYSPRFISLPGELKYQQHLYFPRVAHFNNYYRNETQTTINIHTDTQKSRKRVRMVHPMSSLRAQAEIADSKRYAELDDIDWEGKDDCQLEYEWQRTSRPTCNSIHEFDLTTPTLGNETSKYQYLTHGFYRDVMSAYDDVGQPFVFKPMRRKHRFTFRNFDRMRRDAVIMDRLTAHKYILNIFGFCGTSAAFEYADGGDIDSTLWPDGVTLANLTQLEKLHIATQASMALASVHNVDKEGRPSIAHTDISTGQFIKVNAIYKLNDFNRARFLHYSRSNGTVCPFFVGNNAGNNRSPEEYAYKGETEKVDIYSLGNIFFTILQGEWPFENEDSRDAVAKVLNGTRPAIYEDLWNSDDTVNIALKEAMILCHTHDPLERPSARYIESFFRLKMQEIDPGRLEEWGDA